MAGTRFNAAAITKRIGMLAHNRNVRLKAIADGSGALRRIGIDEALDIGPYERNDKINEVLLAGGNISVRVSR